MLSVVIRHLNLSFFSNMDNWLSYQVLCCPFFPHHINYLSVIIQISYVSGSISGLSVLLQLFMVPSLCQNFFALNTIYE